MHIKLILRALSFIFILLNIFMLPCALYAWATGDMVSFRAFLVSIAICSSPSLLFIFLSRSKEKSSFSPKDSFLMVCLAWVGASLVSAVPFQVSGAMPNWADAFFEAASGFSTTGATILTDIEAVPRAILLWRSLTHWLGGMGIVVLTVALLPLLGIGGMQLVKAEGESFDSKMTPRIAQTAKFLWLIYVLLTVVSFLFLWAGEMDAYDAINHAFSAISSGGFSTKNASAGYFQTAYTQWVLIAIMAASGVSFAIYFRLFTGKFQTSFKNTELKSYFIFMIAASVAIIITNAIHHTFTNYDSNIRHSIFQVVSLMTTTGLGTSDYELWPAFSQYILLLLFFIGGCSSSTSGGFKVVRLVVLLKQGINEMRYLLHPKGVFTLRLNGAPVDKRIVFSVSGFFFIYVVSVLAMGAVVASAGVDATTSLSVGLSLIGSVGPAFGAIGPTDNYGFLPDYVKWISGIGMLMGRLELYTFLVLFMPFFWKRY